MNFETDTKEIKDRQRQKVRENFRTVVPVNATMQFVVVGEGLLDQPSRGDNAGNGAGCPTYRVGVAPLAVENDIASAQHQYTQSFFITLPLVNKDIEGHEVDKKTLSKAIRNLQAIVPARVKYVDRGTPDAWKNDKDTKRAIRAQEMEAKLVSAELARGDLKLEGCVFYADTVAKNSGDGYFLNSMSAELQSGKTWSAPVEASSN